MTWDHGPSCPCSNCESWRAGGIKPINPGRTFNIFTDGHLTQTQHKGDRVEVVDHFGHETIPVPGHIKTSIDRDGNTNTEIIKK